MAARVGRIHRDDFMVGEGVYTVTLQPPDVSVDEPTYTVFVLTGCRLGLKQNLAVKILGAYCLIGYILIQILLFAVWCRPVSQVWLKLILHR